MRRPAWSGPPPNHLGVVKRVINNSIQERWPSGDPFVRHAFFGKYSDFQTNTDFLNDGNRRRSASMEYCGRLQVTRQKCRARTKPLESIRKEGLGS